MIRIDATIELAKTWMWLRGPSPPETPVDEWVNRSLTSWLTWISRQPCPGSKLMDQAYLRHERPCKEEHHQKREENAPRMEGVRYGGHYGSRNAEGREGVPRP